MWSNEKAFTFFLIVMSSIFFVGSLEFTMFTKFGGVGAGLLPRVLSLTLFVLAIVNLLIIIREKRVESNPISKGALRSQLFLSIIVILSLMLTNVVGMLLAMFLFTFATLRFIEKMTWTISLVFSTVFIVSIFLIFEIWLELRLPNGLLF